MSTRTPGAVGTKPRAPAITPQATRGPTLLLLAAMEGRKRAAVHPLLAEAEAEAVGNPGRRVPVVRQAAAAVAAGEVAGEADGVAQRKSTLSEQCC